MSQKSQKSQKAVYYVITGRGVCGPYTREEAKRISDYGLARQTRGSITEINSMVHGDLLTAEQKRSATTPQI